LPAFFFGKEKSRNQEDMRQALDAISALAQPVLESEGLELLEIRLVHRKRRSSLQLTIDRLDGAVSIQDCETVSRRLSRILDVEDPIPGSYNLEVSSPGFKRLIRIPGDLPRFVGHRVRLQLSEPVNDRKVWIGILTAATDPIRLDKTDAGSMEFPYGVITRANLDE